MQPNIAVCLLFMFASGFFGVCGTVLLAYQTHRQRTATPLIIVLHVILLTLGAVSSVVATWFGPVSLAVPINTASQLACNAIALTCLKMRVFHKSQRVGTYVVVLAVLCLMDVAGEKNVAWTQAAVAHQLGKPQVLAWCILLPFILVGCSIHTGMLLIRQRRRDQARVAITTLDWAVMATGTTLCNTTMATLGKMLGILTTTSAWYGVAVFYVAVACTGLIFSITSSMVCEQGIYIPLTSVGLLICNMLTGLILWDDARAIHGTWIAYLCSLMTMCCGVYLLSDADLIPTIPLSEPSMQEPLLPDPESSDESFITTVGCAVETDESSLSRRSSRSYSSR